MSSEREGRDWRKYAWRGALVGISALGSYGLINYLDNRENNSATIAIIDEVTATTGFAGEITGGETPVFFPIATQAQVNRSSGERCGVIDGKPNAFRVVLDQIGIGSYSPDIQVVVYDGSDVELDGDAADGSIKHGPKPIGEYKNKEYVHSGDKVCIVEFPQAAQYDATSPSPTITATSTLEPTPTAAYDIQKDSVNCSALGLPLDLAITEGCAVVGQSQSSQKTITCSGEGGLNGFAVVTVYDFDPVSSENPAAVSVHAQIGSGNTALPRKDFGGTCTDWRRQIPPYFQENPDLFTNPQLPPTPSPSPEASIKNSHHGFVQIPSSGMAVAEYKAGVNQIEDRRQETRDDFASLVAASTFKKGTLRADTEVAYKQNRTITGILKRNISFRGRI